MLTVPDRLRSWIRLAMRMVCSRSRAVEEPVTEVYSSLQEAAAGPHGVVVLSAEMGTVIYVTVPAAGVRCSVDQLTTLVYDLDAMYWMGGRNNDARVGYHEVEPLYVLEGADGGGQVTGDFWANPNYLDDEVAALARDVVEGRRARLPGGVLRDRRAARLAELRSRRESGPPLVVRGEVHAWDYDVDEPLVPFPASDV